MGLPATAPEVVAQVRELRYMDGLSGPAVGRLLGVDDRTVYRYAPGRIGKVPNDRVRALFERSPLSATDVARRMGWRKKGGGTKKPGEGADGLRVLRSLGLREDRCRGYRSFRVMIDAETAGDLAEAMGFMRWEALPDDQWA